MTNRYCQLTGIDIPSLAVVKDHREAKPFALLLVTLLEHGGPLTLDQVADRLAQVGAAPREQALLSLKRCRPARPPVYRDGDLYGLDPYDDELDFWLFRLGLRPPRVPRLKVVPAEPTPLPGPEVELSPEELQEAFHRQNLYNWSAQRLALAVLDAHGPTLDDEHVIAILNGLTDHHGLFLDSAGYWRSGAISVDEGGSWSLDPGHGALPSARTAIRKKIVQVRRQKEQGRDPATVEAYAKAAKRRRAAKAEQLARLRRVLLYAFPPEAPRALVLLDVKERKLTTFVDPEPHEVAKKLAAYDFIAAMDIRPLLRELSFDPEHRRLADLSPPQKTLQLNRGRTLKITAELLIQGSCRIGKPFGDSRKLARYLRNGEIGRLRRRLEADAKSLFALYNYGKLHHAVKLDWGFMNLMLPVRWMHRDEPRLYHIMKEAFETGRDLEVVVDTAPGWKNPWARGRRCAVNSDEQQYIYFLVDEEGRSIQHDEVQIVRIWGEDE